MFCEGQLLPIAEYETLFQLIGTTYGGDGQTTYGLPDLRGRVPIHQGNSFILAETGGAEEITLTVNQIPSHSHVPLANSGNGTTSDPTNNFWAAQPALLQYSGTGSANINLPADTIAPVGGSQPHTNFQPYLCVDFIISLFGNFPSQT
jgi:microcystin-dependent protein